MSYIVSLPSKLKIVKEEGFAGVYEIEGLYPGYGHTLGNSLRRIILSSIPGASVTEIKIEGVEHEYQTIEGIKEDVLTIVLAIRRLRFKLLTDEPQIATISLSGERKVSGADLKLPGQLEILNPDSYICELTSKKSSLNVSIKVENGLGFIPKTERKGTEKSEIGAIVVDAVFTPIRKVSYEVENMRVGDQTNYNRLRISIETDGTLLAREAFEFSIKTMIDQLRFILDLKDQEERPVVSVEEIEAEVMQKKNDIESEDISDVLKTRIETVDLSTRLMNSLSEASIRTLGGLVRKSAIDLLEIEGIGEKGVEEIRAVLNEYGLNLKDE